MQGTEELSSTDELLASKSLPEQHSKAKHVSITTHSGSPDRQKDIDNQISTLTLFSDAKQTTRLEVSDEQQLAIESTTTSLEAVTSIPHVTITSGAESHSLVSNSMVWS